MKGDYKGVQIVERYPCFFVPAAQSPARPIQWLTYLLGTRAERTT